MSFCKHCGTQIADGMKFCPKCGTAVEAVSQTSKASSAAASPSALSQILAVLKRNYMIIGIAVLAVVILLQLSRCAGGGKEDSFLEQIEGYWVMETQVYSDSAAHVDRPWILGITENAVQLDANRSTCPMSETEFKNDALYFSAQWYDSDPGDGRTPGIQDYDLRLTYSKNDDLLTLEVEVSNKWYALGEYTRDD